MKTINELEQEAKQAREELCVNMVSYLPISSRNAGIIADKLILASVAMVAYQFAQAEQLHNGEVIRIDDSKTHTFTVPIDATSRGYVYSNGEIRVVSGDTQSMESCIKDSFEAKLRRNEEKASENYLHGDGSGNALPEVSQEERDSDGFIKWGGSKRPVQKYQKVHVKFKDGDEDIGEAVDFCWDDDLIVAYRRVKGE